MTHNAQEARARRLLDKQGYGLSKIRQNSRWYPEYGPFMVIDYRTQSVVRSGLDLDEVLEWALSQ